jgi:hypothetical protein
MLNKAKNRLLARAARKRGGRLRSIAEPRRRGSGCLETFFGILLGLAAPAVAYA